MSPGRGETTMGKRKEEANRNRRRKREEGRRLEKAREGAERTKWR